MLMSSTVNMLQMLMRVSGLPIVDETGPVLALELYQIFILFHEIVETQARSETNKWLSFKHTKSSLRNSVSPVLEST